MLAREISFPVNNGGLLSISQDCHGGPAIVVSGSGETTIIPAKDMVQLVNLYRYVKRYDIADSFINPCGRYSMEGGMLAPAASAVPPAGPADSEMPVWFFLAQDGDAGYHIFRRPVDEFNPDPEKREDANFVYNSLNEQFKNKYGGSFLSSWVQSQLVECSDLADFQMDTPFD